MTQQIDNELLSLLASFTMACEQGKIEDTLIEKISQTLVVIGLHMSTSPEMEQAMLDLMHHHKARFSQKKIEDKKPLLRLVQ